MSRVPAAVRSPSAWVLAIGLILGAVVLATDLAPRVADAYTGFFAALPVIVIGVAVVAAAIVLLDRSHAHVPSAWVLAFAWGAVAACGLALRINGFAADAVNDVLGEPGSTTWGAALIGPLNEETIKGVGVALILVIYRHRARPIRRPLQAFAVGAFCGLGFQMVENVSYAVTLAVRNAQSDVVGALVVAILRAITGLQSHWVYTGFMGVGLLLLLSRPLLGMLAIALAYALHFLWNAPAGDAPLLVLALIVGKFALTLALLGAAWAAMLREHRQWLRAVIATPHAQRLAPPGELATLPTRQSRRAALGYVGYYWGPDAAQVAQQRQKWLLRELTALPLTGTPPTPGN